MNQDPIQKILHTHKALIILIGIPASGKSTFYQQKLHSLIHINLDTLKNRNRERIIFNEAIRDEASIVVDNTNVTRAERSLYIDIAKKKGYTIFGFFFQSRVKECVERNAQRKGIDKIPSQAIAAKSNQLEMPEFTEGLDELHFVEIRNESFYISQWRTDLTTA